jgi:hypothetical protein
MPAFCPLGDKIMKASITLVVLLLGLSPAAAGGPLRRDVINLRDILIRMLAAFGIFVAMASGAFADEQAILQYTGAGSAARALFPANDMLDWGQLGPPCPSGGQLCIPSGAVATSNRGIAITINDTGGFNRADEGTIAWSGHFQLGDHVVTDGSAFGQITFTLDKLVAGIGFELSPDSGTVPATVQIFDAENKLLSSITQPAIGGARIPPCNNAAFFGFYDPKGRIASLVINPNDIGARFGWNQVSLIDEPQLSFAGTPGQKNCRSQSIATLRGLYGGLENAAAALGFTSTAALRNDIKEYCGE